MSNNLPATDPNKDWDDWADDIPNPIDDIPNPIKDDLEKIIRFNINAPLIADARITDLVEALTDYIAQSNQQLLDKVLEGLPEKSNKLPVDRTIPGSWVERQNDLRNMHIEGFNDALDQCKQVIERFNKSNEDESQTL